MARPAPPDDGSPVRLVATMVGIVGILLLGSLTWTAVGAFFSAVTKDLAPEIWMWQADLIINVVNAAVED